MEFLELHHKSSQEMSEVEDKSVNVVLFDPPYNIGTEYGALNDLISNQTWDELLQEVVSETVRTLHEKSRVYVLGAESVQQLNRTFALGEYLQNLFLDEHMFVNKRHIVYESGNDGVISPGHNWRGETSLGLTHSNCIQFMELSFEPGFDGGEITYETFKPNDYHPCPTPQNLLERFVTLQSGEVCLEPFMGSGEFGLFARKKGCSYVGYELDKNIFTKTQERLQ